MLEVKLNTSIHPWIAVDFCKFGDCMMYAVDSVRCLSVFKSSNSKPHITVFPACVRPQLCHWVCDCAGLRQIAEPGCWQLICCLLTIMKLPQVSGHDASIYTADIWLLAWTKVLVLHQTWCGKTTPEQPKCTSFKFSSYIDDLALSNQVLSPPIIIPAYALVVADNFSWTWCRIICSCRLSYFHFVFIPAINKRYIALKQAGFYWHTLYIADELQCTCWFSCLELTAWWIRNSVRLFGRKLKLRSLFNRHFVVHSPSFCCVLVHCEYLMLKLMLKYNDRLIRTAGRFAMWRTRVDKWSELLCSVC